MRSVAAFVIVSVVTPVTCVIVIIAALIFLPLPATLPEPKPILESGITHVLDTQGNEIGVFKHFETYLDVPQASIPQVLKNAVVSAEDRNFYKHGGVDVGSTIRALWDDIQNRATVQGGSTITQQYVKNAFTTGERTIARKIREAILASQLERTLDKDTILYKYLSTIYFGEGAYGVGAAAQTYFRIAPEQISTLTVSQAALLASIIPAPSRYSPRVNPWIAEQRRVLVLDQMRDQGYIDQTQHDAAVAEHLWLATDGDAPGPATVVYPPQQQVSIQPWFTQYVKEWLEANLPGCQPGSCPLLDAGGLTVKTTLDPKVQQAAEEEVANAMGDNDPRLQMALVAVEPPTGFVRALVGGRDFEPGVNEYNTAIRDPGRQPGSSFKPFVLAAALEEGIQPTRRYSGATFVAPNGDTIHNVEGEGSGTFDLRSATVHSVNAVFARLILDVGVDKAMEMAQRLGVDMPAYDPNRFGASVALGAIEAKPLQMASAYGVFANHGRRAAPTPVLQVIGPNGQVILDNSKAAESAAQVIPEVVADNVTDILRGVLVNGTAAGKGLGDRPAAGKTGTAEGAGNAWFVGYTPTLSTAVWMGYQDCNCPMRGINGVREVFGGTIPASTWQRFMKRALDGVPVTEFAEPAPIKTFADDARRSARGGFDPGPRRYPSTPSGGGGYEVEVTPPDASAPTTTTTSPTSTTTTIPAPPSTVVN
jgi:penicillin-binding protein 1A